MGSRLSWGSRVDFVMVGPLPSPLGSGSFQSIFENDLVKILLRNKTTGFFYAGGNQWTPNLDAAHDFQTGLNAMQYTSKVTAHGVEFVYVQTDATNDFILPAQATYRPEQRL